MSQDAGLSLTRGFTDQVGVLARHGIMLTQTIGGRYLVVVFIRKEQVAALPISARDDGLGAEVL
jgi:hypothetical protein